MKIAYLLEDGGKVELAEQGGALGVDMKALKLRVGIFGAEPCSQQMCDEIEKIYGRVEPI